MEYNVFQNNKLLDLVKNKVNWNLYRLTDILDDDTKNAMKIKKEDYLENGKYPIIDQGQSVIAGYYNNDNKLYTNHPVIIFGDHTRIIKYADFPIFIGADGVKLLKPLLDRDELNVKYIYYFLSIIQLPSDGYSRHFKYLKEVVIPVPKIEIQEKIVKVLDKSQELINKRKVQIEALDELVKSKFIEMFGDTKTNPKKYETNCLESLADIVSGITKGRKTNNKELFQVPYMRVANVKDGYIDWSEIKTIDATKEEIERYRLVDDDVLMTEGGDADKLGRGSILYNPPENCIHQNHIFRVRLNKNIINPVYFSEYLKHPLVKFYFLRSAKQTTGIASINMTQLKKSPVLLPPIELQNQFAEFVNQIDKLKFEMQKSLEEMENNFNSLMQRAFNGELFK